MTDSNIPVFRAQLRYQSVDDFIEGYSRFILPGKMFVPLKESQLKPPDSRVRFEFRLADGSRALVGEGVVEGVRDAEEADSGGPTGLIVRYTHLSRRSKQLIGQIVDQKRAEARSKQERESPETEEQHAPPPEADRSAPQRTGPREPSPESGAEPAPPEQERPGLESETQTAEIGDADTAPGELEPDDLEDAPSGDEPVELDDPSPSAPPEAEQSGPGEESSPVGESGGGEPAAAQTEDASGDASSDAFAGLEEVSEGRMDEDSLEGFTQLGETEGGLQVMAFDDGDISEEGAESFAEFQEGGDEEEDVDELFDGVFQSGDEQEAGGELFGSDGDDEADLFAGDSSDEESDLVDGAEQEDEPDLFEGAEDVEDEASEESGATSNETVPQEPAAPAKSPGSTAEAAEPVEPEAPPEADEPVEPEEEALGTGEEISSAIEEELEDDGLADDSSDGASSLDADSFSDVEEEEDEDFDEPLGVDDSEPVGFDQESKTSEVQPLPEQHDDEIPGYAEETGDFEPPPEEELTAEPADRSDELRETERETEGSFIGAREDSEDLDNALESLDAEEGGKKDISLSVSGEDEGDTGEPEPVSDEGRDSDSLEALVADAQKDIERRQKGSQDDEEDGDALDEVLGEDLPPPPDDDFEFEMPSSGAELDAEPEPSSDEDSDFDEDSNLEDQYSEESEEEKKDGSFFSNFFGGDS